MSSPNRRFRDDHGTGLIATIGAVTVFLVMMLFSVQLLVGLYADSVVTAAGYEAARMVAGARTDSSDPSALAQAHVEAERRASQLLGHAAADTTLDWSTSTPDTVVLRIRTPKPRLAWPGTSTGIGSRYVDKTIRVRTERWR